MELKAFLWFLVSGGGAGIVAYWLMDNVAWFAGLNPKPKRWVAFALSAIVACLAFTASVFAGYSLTPVGALCWIEQLFSVATAAFGLATLLHINKLPDTR